MSSSDDNPGLFTRLVRTFWDDAYGRTKGGRGWKCSQNVQCSVGNRFNVRCYEGRCINKRKDPEKFAAALAAEDAAAAKREAELKAKRKGRRGKTFVWPVWDATKRQGQRGFTKYVTSWLKTAGFQDEGGMTLACDASFPIQAYQEIPSALVHPNSTIDRLMLVARTGSGKTLTMINIMNNYFNDPRVKLIIVPGSEIKANMLKNIVLFDNLYRDYVIQEMRIMLKLKRGDRVAIKGWVALMMKNLDCVEKVLKKHGNPKVLKNVYTCKLTCWGKIKRQYYTKAAQTSSTSGTSKRRPVLDLLAPIRIMTYGEVSAPKIKRKEDSFISAIPPYEEYFDEKGAARERPAKTKQNAMSHKIIFMDEAHNLLYPPEKERKNSKRQTTKLVDLREMLRKAHNSVIVLATATPIVKSETKDPDMLLNVLRGAKYGPMTNATTVNSQYPTNEGFVSYFQDTPASIYPQVLPGGSVEGALPEIHYVDMAGAIAKKYREKKDMKNKLKQRNYTNMAFYYPWTKDRLAKMLDDPYGYAPKFAEIADTIVEVPMKTLIMCHRASGIRYLNAMIEHKRKALGLEQCFETLYFPGNDGISEGERNPVCVARAAERRAAAVASRQARRSESKNNNSAAANDNCDDDDGNNNTSGRKGSKERRFKESLEQAFNGVDNKVGEQILTITADSQEYSEGVSFDSPTRLILVDVPLDYRSYLQQTGRLMRMCKYQNNPKLSEGDRIVTMQMYVGRFPKDADNAPRTIDEQLLDNLRREFVSYRRIVEEKFKSISVDSETLDPFVAKIQAQYANRYGSNNSVDDFDDDATPIIGADGLARVVRMDPLMKQPITTVEHNVAYLAKDSAKTKPRRSKASATSNKTSATKRKPKRTSKGKKKCNAKSAKANDPAYECGPFGRYRRKK